MRTLLALWLALAAPVARSQSPEIAVEAPMKDEDAGKPLATAPLEAPPSAQEADERTIQLASQLRCPVCQGLSIGASPSEAARAMRDRVHELVSLGYSDDQIVDYFVGRYGTWVLLAPPRQGFTWLLWMAPAVGLSGGLLWVMSRAQRRAAAAVAPSPDPDAAPPGPADPYRARILAELGEGAEEQRSS